MMTLFRIKKIKILIQKMNLRIWLMIRYLMSDKKFTLWMMILGLKGYNQKSLRMKKPMLFLLLRNKRNHWIKMVVTYLTKIKTANYTKSMWRSILSRKIWNKQRLMVTRKKKRLMVTRKKKRLMMVRRIWNKQRVILFPRSQSMRRFLQTGRRQIILRMVYLHTLRTF